MQCSRSTPTHKEKLVKVADLRLTLQRTQNGKEVERCCCVKEANQDEEKNELHQWHNRFPYIPRLRENCTAFAKTLSAAATRSHYSDTPSHCHPCDGSVTNQRQTAQHSTEQCSSSSRPNGKTNGAQSETTQSKIRMTKMKQNDTPVTTNTSKYKEKRNCWKKEGARAPHALHFYSTTQDT